MYHELDPIIETTAWLKKAEVDSDYTTDFGNILKHQPICIASPSTIDELKRTIEIATEYKLAISIRGCAHTTGGQTLVERGMLINMKNLNKIGDVQKTSCTGESYIGLEPGASWHDVFMKCITAGFTPPTYADWLHLSVGGTVSTGGIGQCSFLHGSQADNVIGLEALTIDEQEIIHCNQYENKDLFDAIRAGLGQIAVITKVNMRLHPAPERVTIFKLLYKNLHDFIEAQRSLISQKKININAIQSHIVINETAQIEKRAMMKLSLAQTKIFSESESRWIYALEVTCYSIAEEVIEAYLKSTYSPELIFRHECSFEEHVTRIPPVFQNVKHDEMISHHHCCVFMSADNTETFVREILARSRKENTGNGTILLIPLDTSVIHAPALVMPKSKQVFMVAFLRILNPNWSTSAELEGINNFTHELALSTGGKIYPVGTYQGFTNPHFWQQHFCEIYAQRMVLKKKYDVNGCLSPGVKLF